MFLQFISGIAKHTILAIRGNNDGGGLPEKATSLYFVLFSLYLMVGIGRGFIIYGSPFHFTFLSGIATWLLIFVFSRPNQYNVTSIFFCLSIGIAFLSIFVSILIGQIAGPFFMGWELIAFWFNFNKMLSRKGGNAKK